MCKIRGKKAFRNWANHAKEQTVKAFGTERLNVGSWHIKMRRLAFHVLVAGLTFSSGLVLSGLATRYADPAILLFDDLTSSISSPPLQRVGGIDACGPKANFHTWDLSDGTQITIACMELSSARAAKRDLDRRVSRATEIIERVPELGQSVHDRGQTVGERVVFRTVGVTLVETYENNLCVTEAASLEHLRWYEGR